MKQQVLMLHGTAERNPFFAASLVNNIIKLMGKDYDPSNTILTQAFYGDLFQPAEDAVNSKLAENPLWKKEHLLNVAGIPLRFYVNQFVSDVFQWDQNPAIQLAIANTIHTFLDTTVDALHIVTHSWGSIISLSKATFISEMLLTSNCKSLTTLGNPMYWYDWNNNLVLPGKSVIWNNFFHTDDLVGVPLNSIYGCADIQVTDSGPPDILVGGEEAVLAYQAHNCYWSSKQVATSIVEQLKNGHEVG